jgi:hypothetical protein
MKVTLSYAERIINALAHTKHTRDVIANCRIDAAAINEILAPLFAECAKLAKAEARLAVAVEALNYYGYEQCSESDGEIARAALAKIKGGK